MLIAALPPTFTPVLSFGGTPPPFLPFQCLRVTAKTLLQRLWCHEDLSFKIFVPPLAGTIEGLGRRSVPANPPPLPRLSDPPPSPPSNTSLATTHSPCARMVSQYADALP